MISVFVALLCGHYLADFPLQTETIARNKGKVFIESIGFHALTAHAAMHALVAGGVLLALGYPLIGAGAVGLTHWLIDFGKSWEGWPDTWRITDGARWSGDPDARGLYGINVDQALHVAVIAAVTLAVTS